MTFHYTNRDSIMLTDLLPEVLSKILSYLPGKDIFHVGQCSNYLRQVTMSDHIWKRCAKHEFQLDVDRANSQLEPFERLDMKSRCMRVFYLRLLMTYGPFLQRVLLRSNLKYYGGLSKLVYHDWTLLLVVLDPPPFPNPEKDLQPLILCEIYVDQANQVVLRGDHPFMKTVKKLCLYNTGLLLEYKALTKNRKQYLDTFTQQHGLRQFLDYEAFVKRRYKKYVKYFAKGRQHFRIITLPTDEGYRDKVKYYVKGRHRFRPLQRFSSDRGFCPIPIGFFKGTYSVHGMEMIRIFYDDNNGLIGVKVTGDTNVPCNEITFEAKLLQPVEFDEDVRRNFRKISEYLKTVSDMDMTTVNDMNPRRLKQFHLPYGCAVDGSLLDDIFQTYIWQFKASYQVAEPGFEYPSTIDSVLVIFSEDVFGLIVIDFKCLSIYSRVHENLAATCFSDLFPKINLGESRPGQNAAVNII